MYDLVGKSLEKYQIIERLTQTAATEVYKGFHPGMNRYVVVNVLKAEFVENDAHLQRFLEQNDIATKIQHPNLLPLIDFGIALSPELSKNDPFSSPENSRQEPVDHRADIYSLGVLLYELLTDSPPDMERYVSLRSQRPDPPEDVEKVVLKALSDRPEDRFQSVNMFQAALEAAFRYVDRSVEGTIISPVQQPKKRKGWLIALDTVLIILCLGAVTVFALTRAREDDGKGVVSEAPAEPTAERPAPTLEQPAPPPEDPGKSPSEAEDRPGIQLPDYDLPPISEIPICNSIFPAAGLDLVGVVALKARRKASQRMMIKKRVDLERKIY